MLLNYNILVQQTFPYLPKLSYFLIVRTLATVFKLLSYKFAIYIMKMVFSF